MQLQVCIVYPHSAIWKLRSELWQKGTALYYPTQDRAYSRLRPPLFLLRPVLIQLTAWSTVAIEMGLGTLIWIRELRYPALLCSLALHMCIELLLRLQLFGWSMRVSLVLFVEPRDLERWITDILR